MKRETFGGIEKDFIIKIRPLFDLLEDKFSTTKLLGITLGMGFVFVMYSFLGFKDISNIYHFSEYKEPSILFAQNYKGEPIPIAEYYQFSRFVMRGDDLKDNNHYKKPIQTILESEDGNFFYHIGIDPFGIARAAVVNLLAGRVKEGASTITQQVVRVKFLTQERSFKRKIKEIIYSFLVEIFYSKKRILEVYINEVPLGHGTLGLKAASKFYFRKDPEALSWAESAVISGMTTKPMLYSPLVNTDTSYYKVKVILRKLIESGKISPEEAVKELKDLQDNFYGTLNRSPNESAYSDRLNLFPYVTEYSRKLLLKYFNEKQIYEGGLKIYTTIDVQHQREAEKAVSIGLKEVRLNQSPNVAFKNIDLFDDNYGEIADIIGLLNDVNEYKYSFSKSRRQFERNFQEDLRDEVNLLNLLTGTDETGRFIDNTYIHQKKEDNLLGIEASLVSFRPYTGSITAIVGGSGFVPGNQQIRSVQSYRQTGSAFKPILFASAMEYSRENLEAPHKVNASTQFMDSPLQYVTEDGDEWSPDNYSSEYSGFILLRKALELSRNSVAVRVIEHVGLKNLLPYIKKLALIDREIPQNYSVSLGTFEMTPLEITRAYGSFASGGKEVNPYILKSIKDKDDSIIFDFEEERKSIIPKQIVSPETAYIMTSLLEGVVKHGTGKGAKAYGLDRMVVGKTGTTNNYRDAWFVGYTPELVASVWIGYDISTMSLGKGMTGGRISSSMWGRFAAGSLNKEPRKSFEYPESLGIFHRRVCAMSGKIPGESCREYMDEIFDKQNPPYEICKEHESWNENPEQEPIVEKKKPKRKKSIYKGDDSVDL